MRSFLNNITIGRRLLLGFAVVLLCSLLAIGIGIARLHTVAESTRQLLDEPLASERHISDWYRNVFAGVRRSLAIAKSSDGSLNEFFAADIAESTRNSSELQKLIEPSINTPEEQKIWGELSELRKQYLASRDEVLALKKQGESEKASSPGRQQIFSGRKKLRGQDQGTAAVRARRHQPPRAGDPADL